MAGGRDNGPTGAQEPGGDPPSDDASSTNEIRERSVVLARIGAPHGVRGAVRLNVFAQDPLTLRRYNPFRLPDGRHLKLLSVKPSGKALIATLEGIGDRAAAESLRNLDLSVPRSRLPKPDEDEFYHVDLIGLEARHVDGTRLGVVKAVSDFGAGELLEIGGRDGLLVPFTRAAVPTIDLAAGFLVVDPPALVEAPDIELTPDAEGDGSGRKATGGDGLAQGVDRRAPPTTGQLEGEGKGKGEGE